MVNSWSEPAQILITGVPRDLGGLWSLLYAGELGAVHLNASRHAPRDAVGVAIDLRAAVQELEWHHPELDLGQVAVNLESPARGGGTAYESTLAELLHAALGLCADLIRDPTSGLPDVLMLARVVTLVTSGHIRLTGHLP
jgi:hypothetical protein